jgi:hypothetical protein
VRYAQRPYTLQICFVVKRLVMICYMYIFVKTLEKDDILPLPPPPLLLLLLLIIIIISMLWTSRQCSNNELFA